MKTCEILGSHNDTTVVLGLQGKSTGKSLPTFRNILEVHEEGLLELFGPGNEETRILR